MLWLKIITYIQVSKSIWTKARQKLAFPMMCPYFLYSTTAIAVKGVLNARKLSPGPNVLPNSCQMRDAPHVSHQGELPWCHQEGNNAPSSGKELGVLKEKVNIFYKIHCWTNNFPVDKHALQICIYYEKNSNPCNNLTPWLSGRALRRSWQRQMLSQPALALHCSLWFSHIHPHVRYRNRREKWEVCI